MPGPDTDVRFSAVTAVNATGEPGVFDAHAHPAWTIAGKPNGGYLLALLARAATAVVPQSHVVAASAHYLRPPDAGEVRVRVDVLRTGRSASQLHAVLEQGGRPCVHALLTLADLPSDSAPHWDAAAPAEPPGTREQAIRVPGTNPGGVPVPIMDIVDVRIDPDSYDFRRGAPSGRGELRGWLALPDDDPFDPVSLLFAIDALPPATFDVEFTGWVPTLELTAYVRALPAPGPVRVVQRAQLIEAQRVDEVCWVWDSRGRLVAQATQLAAIRLG